MVGPKAERGFKVEGTVWLDPRTTTPAGPEGPGGCRNSVVAGAGFDTVESRLVVSLPWAA